MALNHLNEHLNDAFEVYFPKRNSLGRLVYRTFNAAILLALRLRIRLFRGRWLVNERIVEYPQVFRWIRPSGSILDIGCTSSRLPIQLASLGYEVHGVDIRAYPFSHPNFRFYQVDLFQWEPGRQFDICIAISTIEHLGLGTYGDEVLADADKEAVRRIWAWLRPEGQLIVSMPFGRPQVTRKHRIYSLEQLKSLFTGFEWLDARYYRRQGNAWVPSSAEELREVASPGLPVNGVVLLNLQRKLTL